jgi:hypothetical protein
LNNQYINFERKLEGTLVYTCIQEPRPCYDAEKGTEWKASIVIIDEDAADAFAEMYPKQAPKKVKSAEFEEKYQCELPEGAGKNVWVITVKKNTKLANGEPVPLKYRPKVYQRKGTTLVDITNDVKVGNGSTGQISVEHYDAKLGPVARLKNVLVENLVEYEGRESADDGAEFMTDTPAPAPAKAKAAAAPAPKAKAKPAPAPVEDEDVPF